MYEAKPTVNAGSKMCHAITHAHCRRDRKTASNAITQAASAAKLCPDGHALFFEHLLELAVLEHLADDVAASDELALDVKLRDRRPVRKLLDALAHRRVGEHVDTAELDAHMAEYLHHRRREPALRKDRRALHEQDDGSFGDLLADAFVGGDVHLGVP